MGTRGLMAFVVDGELKGMYNHFDSYPSGLGNDILQWLKGVDKEKAKEQVKLLEAVNEDEKPTEEQIEKLMKYANLSVNNRSLEDWYSLLRETQGNPQATLDAVFYVEGKEFARDSLFCEWGYVVDFDDEVLEIYKGFQTGEKSLKGKFAEWEPYSAPHRIYTEYTPINLVESIRFSSLDDFSMDDFEEAIYSEEDDD